ncbi:hypothetical protein [Microbacterium sp. zg-YB36]|uniref:phage tail tube protein n=1 Tax=Microbacterium sp. zg-YB36 TaxID=2969407 RepID=UPI00214C6021|nr:hypothetical protein [Microbacterium sp. zg-YB36]MDL5351099.1 hypothetical protein [Microbacterium sp. zg-YB36]
MASRRIDNEDEAVVVLPAYEVLGEPYAVLPSGLVPWDELTSADINHYAVVTTPAHSNAGAGGNVTCAIVSDGFTLQMTGSEEDDERTLCDPGNSVDLTDFNFDADMTGFRDANPAATDSVFNLWKNLTFAPDVPYIIIHRVGFDSTTAFAEDQEIYTYYAHTDLPVNVHDDGSKQKIQSVFIQKDALGPRFLDA